MAAEEEAPREQALQRASGRRSERVLFAFEEPLGQRQRASTLVQFRHSMESDSNPDLCSEIRTLLEAELAAGNQIAYVDRAISDPNAHLVMLKRPFRIAHSPDARVKRVAVNDPHWWGTEYSCMLHHHQLVCPVS